MYNALNVDYMFQQMDERTAGMRTARQEVAARVGRRWWRKATHHAR
jgi:hypothetical protein